MEEFVEAMPWGRFNWKVLFQCGACWACDAMEMMLVSFMVPVIEAYWLEGRSPRYRATVKGLVVRSLYPREVASGVEVRKGKEMFGRVLTDAGALELGFCVVQTQALQLALCLIEMG